MINFDDYAFDMGMVVSNLDRERLDYIVNLILSKWRTKNHIYLFGNGGSAYIASHFALDLFKTTGKFVKAISLCNDAGMILAIGNDIGFVNSASYSLYGNVVRGDLAIFFTTSGNSPNVCDGIAFCKNNGIDEITFTGGGEVLNTSQYPFHIPCKSVTMTESIFSILCHYITERIKDEPIQLF